MGIRIQAALPLRDSNAVTAPGSFTAVGMNLHPGSTLATLVPEHRQDH